MPLSDTVRYQAETILTEYCRNRVPPHLREQIRMHHEVRGETVTLFEDRPRWNDPSEWTHNPVAQFRFDIENGQWSLYYADRNSRWHRYDPVKPSSSLEQLLKAIDDDPSGIFFG